jgi:hypothetical protein
MNNQCTNPSFEVNTSGWDEYGVTAVLSRVQEVPAKHGDWEAKSLATIADAYGIQYQTPAPVQNQIWRGRGAIRSNAAVAGDTMGVTMQERGGATGSENGTTRNVTVSSSEWIYSAYSVRQVVRTDRTEMLLFLIGTSNAGGDILYFDDVYIHRLDNAQLAGTILKYNPISYYMMDDRHPTESVDVTGFTNCTHSSSCDTGLSPVHSADREGMGSMGFHNNLGDGLSAGQQHKFLGTVPFSICCWVELEAFNSVSGHWAVNAQDVTNGYDIHMNAENVISFWRGDTGGGANLDYTHPTSLVNRPTFVCIRYDGTNKHIDIDGVADVVTPQASSQSIASHLGEFRVGVHSFGGSGWEGRIDEVGVFNYDIGGAASTAIYQAGTTTHVKQTAHFNRTRTIGRR